MFVTIINLSNLFVITAIVCVFGEKINIEIRLVVEYLFMSTSTEKIRVCVQVLQLYYWLVVVE